MTDEATRVVVAAVRALLADLGHGPDVPVGPDTHLEAELGFDSLTVAELAVRVEAVAGQRIPDRAVADVATVGDLAAVVAGTATTTSPGAGRPAPPAPPPGTGPSGRGATPGGPRLAGVYALVVFGLVAVVAWPLVAVLPDVARRWQVVRAAGRLVLALTGTRLRVRGADQLPAEGGYVVVANHASFLDPLVLALVLPPPVVFAAIAGLAERRLVAVFLRRLEAELVAPPSERARALADAARLRGLARRGHRLALFPEGHRSTDVGLDPFRMGAFVAAAEAGVPVVPVTIRGTRAVLPVHARWPRRGRIEVLVAAPVTATSPGWAGAVELRRAAREEILRTSGEPDLTRP